jgi:hypothetical protein
LSESLGGRPAGYGANPGILNDARPEIPSSLIELRHAATDRPMLVVVPARRMLVIDGLGRPGAAGFHVATSLLRTVDNAIRAALRRERIPDGPRALAEVAWLTGPQGSLEVLVNALAEHVPVRWRQMIELPRFASPAIVDQAIQEIRSQSGRDYVLTRAIVLTEGRAAQMLHLGPAADPSSTIERLSMLMTASGQRPRGDPHLLVFGSPPSLTATLARSILRIPIQ